MQIIKKILRFIFLPHGIVFFLLIPLSSGLLIYAFLPGAETKIQYLAYFISACTLIAFCCKLPDFIRLFSRLRNENALILRYRHDTRFRVSSALYASFAFNAMYAFFQMILGIRHKSIWFYSISLYYLLLAVMRFLLLNSLRNRIPGENIIHELKRYRFCGFMLVMMNLSLAVIVFYITWQNRTFRHHEITTIAMAAYTFASFTVSAVNAIKYRKYNSPVYSAAKAISFAAAMVSMLTLETAMLTAFGDPAQESFRRIMTGSTGAAVTVSVLIMAICMIRNANLELKYYRKETQNGQQ